jgi:hypothetical protein
VYSIVLCQEKYKNSPNAKKMMEQRISDLIELGAERNMVFETQKVMNDYPVENPIVKEDAETKNAPVIIEGLGLPISTSTGGGMPMGGGGGGGGGAEEQPVVEEKKSYWWILIVAAVVGGIYYYRSRKK